MRLSKYLAAMVMAATGTAPAAAAPVINTYQVVSRFAMGPLSSITQQYTLAFDPAASTSAMAVLQYSTSTSDPSFNPVGGVLFSVSPPQSQFAGDTVAVGGAINGVSPPVAGSFDFETLFFVSPVTGAVASGGQLIPFNADTRYSNAGTTVFETFDVTVTLLASSVPEVGTWAMMVAGIGVAGCGLRRRRRAMPVLRPAG